MCPTLSVIRTGYHERSGNLVTDARCAMCGRTPLRVGVLCSDCADELIGPVTITPEQIQTYGETDTNAALIDVWGGLHPLASETVLGRTIDPPALSIIDSSISRHHARLWRTEDGWRVQDMGSKNRTHVDAASAIKPLAIKTGQQLRLGYIAFFFVEDASKIVPAPGTLRGRTVRAERRAAEAGETRAIDPMPDVSELPLAIMELQQPTGGGVGIAVIDGKRLELTLPQYELIVRLVDRMLAGADEPIETRGFLRAAELASVLSLDATKPDEDNIRQLVRRVRRACARAGIRSLIETRYAMGYRLTITPRIKS